MPPAADGMAGHPEQSQDGANHHDDNSDRPDDGDLRNEPDDEQYNAENDHVQLLAVMAVLYARSSLAAFRAVEGKN
jgi:hypothetical protein